MRTRPRFKHVPALVALAFDLFIDGINLAAVDELMAAVGRSMSMRRSCEALRSRDPGAS